MDKPVVPYSSIELLRHIGATGFTSYRRRMNVIDVYCLPSLLGVSNSIHGISGIPKSTPYWDLGFGVWGSHGNFARQRCLVSQW